MRIKNHKELKEAYLSHVMDRFFITPEAENVIKDALEYNLKLLTDSYGEDGGGGYIEVLAKDITTDEGLAEYSGILTEYNFNSDDCEFDDCLVTSGKESVHMQLFVLTEYHLILLFLSKGA